MSATMHNYQCMLSLDNKAVNQNQDNKSMKTAAGVGDFFCLPAARDDALQYDVFYLR